MASLHERLAAARERLMRAGISRQDATLDAEVLARHVLNCDRGTLLIRARDPLPSAFDRLFDDLVERRLAREPVAYITGHREFWGLEFEVSPDVLIPRPETELIIEEAIAATPVRDAVHRIVDVGTGSGCLAVALAIEFPSASVVAIDCSRAALAVAERNCTRHNVTKRVSVLESDLLNGLSGSADLIVANPPYVRNGDAPALQPEVGRHEPATALFGGTDGLGLIRRLLAEAPAHLADGGQLIFEFGAGQDDDVVDACRLAGWTVDHVREDLQGIPRVVVLRR
jgi:release factor glutamine methyltransferase